jgi:hypothetical protein
MKVLSEMTLQTFDGSTVEKDADGLLWIRDSFGNIACEAFFADECCSVEDMLDRGYILAPYQFFGEDIFVQAAPEGAE